MLTESTLGTCRCRSVSLRFSLGKRAADNSCRLLSPRQYGCQRRTILPVQTTLGRASRVGENCIPKAGHYRHRSTTT
jgi:hypothetical protein